MCSYLYEWLHWCNEGIERGGWRKVKKDSLDEWYESEFFWMMDEHINGWIG